MAPNIDKLKRIRMRMILIFWVGIPVLALVAWFAFYRGRPLPPDEHATQVEQKSPSEKSTPSP